MSTKKKKKTKKKQGTRRVFVPGRALQGPVQFYTAYPCFFFFFFFSILCNPEGNRGKTRMEIQFLIEWLVINSARELVFRET